MKNLIVSYDQKRGIGKENDLLWQRDLQADLQHFKKLTTGNAIIMGRITFFFDLKERLLPNRQTIIVSRQSTTVPGATVVSSMKEAYAAVQPGKQPFVIGGGEIFRQAIHDVDRMYVTEVATTADADVSFPEFSLDDWQEVSREHHTADERNKYAYDFVVFDRRR